MARTKDRRPSMVQRDFSERFKAERKRLHYTQYELAKILKISQEAVASYENYRAIPYADDLVAIALLFKVSVDYLLGVTRTRSQYETNVVVDKE